MSSLSSFWAAWFPNREYKICMVGLDNAGKVGGGCNTLCRRPRQGPRVSSAEGEQRSGACRRQHFTGCTWGKQ